MKESKFLKAHRSLWNMIFQHLIKEIEPRHSGDVILVRTDTDRKVLPGNYPHTLTYIYKK